MGRGGGCEEYIRDQMLGHKFLDPPMGCHLFKSVLENYFESTFKEFVYILIFELSKLEIVIITYKPFEHKINALFIVQFNAYSTVS